MHRTSPLVRGAATASLVVALGAVLPAQWYSRPFNTMQPVNATDWLLTHDTGNGIAVFSAIAQRWDVLSPVGSVLQQICDGLVVMKEGTSTLRGWSAFTNESATQAISPSYSFQTGSNGLAYAVVLDNVPGTFGVLRAYSAITNTWASQSLSALPAWTIVSGANAAVQLDGLSYHAYSPYTGQWATLTVPVAGGVPIAGADFVAVDLQGTSGPRQYAAFSGMRGTWATSPVYPASGAVRVSATGASAMAIRTDTGVAGQFRYAGYSPFTGQWNTSALTHGTASSVSGVAFKNVVRIEDIDPNARFEVFGAANGVWQSLTGANLQEDGVHDDFHVVRQAVGSSCTVYAASAMVGGGYTSIVVPSFFIGVSPGAHQCIVTGGTSANSAWGYSAATNAFTGPVAQPLGSGVSQASSAAVSGFNVQGSAAFGTTAMAFSARWGSWRPGPAISPSESWNTYASGANLAAIRTFPTTDVFAFDEHGKAWLPPVTAPSSSWAVGRCCLLANLGGGTWTAYSPHRGTWSSQAGIGTITSPGGVVNQTENLAWFTDSNNQIRVFASPARTQSWRQWPLSGAWASSGSTPGSTPRVDVSARGALLQYGLLYAALALAPSPLTIPGIGGALDLDPLGAVQVADLGLFDADGVRHVSLQFPSVVPSFTTLWLQLVTVDLVTGQIDLGERATSACFF